ncbi:ndx-4, partial [Pristionchus pacificus]
SQMATVSPVRAAGLVVFRRAPAIEFLLLQASYPPHHWTPPKGHVDPGEDEWTAALRETKEEANIDKDQLSIREDVHHTLCYEVKGKPKTVKYWAAQLKNADGLTQLSHEHQNWKWCSLEEAVKIADYAEMGALLREFHAKLQ